MRKYSASTGHREVDLAARMLTVRIFSWSLVGAFAGVLWGGAGMYRGRWGIGGLLLMVVAVWAATFFVPLALAALSGRAASHLYNPSGSTTPHKREYSHAESLVARGLYEEAVAAFEVAIAEDASDPTPYLRIARVYRDRMDRYEDAARWFKRTLAESDVHAQLALLATKELVELYTEKLADPPRAAPLLARMAEEREGTPEGAWAAVELARVKTIIAGEER